MVLMQVQRVCGGQMSQPRFHSKARSHNCKMNHSFFDVMTSSHILQNSLPFPAKTPALQSGL